MWDKELINHSTFGRETAPDPKKAWAEDILLTLQIFYNLKKGNPSIPELRKKMPQSTNESNLKEKVVYMVYVLEWLKRVPKPTKKGKKSSKIHMHYHLTKDGELVLNTIRTMKRQGNPLVKLFIFNKVARISKL